MGQQVWNSGKVARRLEAVCSFVSLLEEWPAYLVSTRHFSGSQNRIFQCVLLAGLYCPAWVPPTKPGRSHVPVAVSLPRSAWCWAAGNSKPTQLHILSLGHTGSKQMLMMGELIVHLFWTSPSLQHCWQSCLQECFLAWQTTEAGEENPFIFRLIPYNSFWRSLGSSSWTAYPGHWKWMLLQSCAKHRL